MATYRDLFNTRETPQREAVPGKGQVANSEGGYVWGVDKWTRLDRFLLLGSDSPTYYASARELTRENAQSVAECLREDGARAVKRIAEISEAGRAPKNDPALFALAMASSAEFADTNTRRAALHALPRVARTGTHLFHFVDYVTGFRGWGRALRDGVERWYSDMDPDRLAYQVVKYQQRDGWSHRDVLRLTKPEPASPAHDAIYGWVTGKEYDAELVPLIAAFEQAKGADSAYAMVKLISGAGLTREMVPTQWLNDRDVWGALLERMPLHALVRNLGKMTQIGVFTPLNKATDLITAALRNADLIRKSRLHPLSVLVALKTYASGGGVRGSLTWEPVTQIVDALDDAFYLAFQNVQPTGKRIMLALDVSSSMSFGEIAGMTGITPRVGSAAMALITARTEPSTVFTAFTQRMVPLTVSPRQRLDDVVRMVSGLPFGGTDCSLPMLYALERGLSVDAFVIYTDSETWAGRMHPFQALQTYRQRTGIPAKLVVVGMVSNGFSIADPNDGGMLDVVGFDTAAPALIGEFINADLSHD